jgi:hypothetical protein
VSEERARPAPVLSVVIPVYNEALTIGRVVLLPGVKKQINVVDDLKFRFSLIGCRRRF